MAASERNVEPLPTLALHWLSAVLIFVLLGLGWFMVHGDVGCREREIRSLSASQIARASSACLAAASTPRCARLAKASPQFPARHADWERRLAGLTHVTFYLLLLVAALSGWLLVSAAIIAIPTRFFDLFVIPNLVGADAALQANMTLPALCGLAPHRVALVVAPRRGGAQASFRRPRRHFYAHAGLAARSLTRKFGLRSILIGRGALLAPNGQIFPCPSQANARNFPCEGTVA